MPMQRRKQRSQSTSRSLEEASVNSQVSQPALGEDAQPVPSSSQHSRTQSQAGSTSLSAAEEERLKASLDEHVDASEMRDWIQQSLSRPAKTAAQVSSDATSEQQQRLVLAQQAKDALQHQYQTLFSRIQTVPLKDVSGVKEPVIAMPVAVKKRRWTLFSNKQNSSKQASSNAAPALTVTSATPPPKVLTITTVDPAVSSPSSARVIIYLAFH